MLCREEDCHLEQHVVGSTGRHQISGMGKDFNLYCKCHKDVGTALYVPKGGLAAWNDILHLAGREEIAVRNGTYVSPKEEDCR